ncbi:MAG: hypothetical protein AAB654_17620, partial [Acidobacteriota bacterium]
MLLALACSPKSVAGDVNAPADAGTVADGQSDSGAEFGDAAPCADGPAEAATFDVDVQAEGPTDVADVAGELDAADAKPEAEIQTETAGDSDAKSEVQPEIAGDATPACNAKAPQPTSLPNDCSPQCPAPYPCYCATCPWLPTPKMTVARSRHQAVWTGKYVVIAGNYIDWAPQEHLTGERWDMATNYWEPINLGPQLVIETLGAGTTGVVWTGKVVMVMPA